MWFHVYLVKRYGGTPGKLLLKIKITKLDGSEISYREACLRYSVLFVLSIFSAIPIILAAQGITDSEYFSMGWQERSLALMERAPSWYNLVSISMNVWIWSEFIVMLTNKKRRAIHDFIAGTVVINKPLPNNTLNSDAASVAG